MLTKSSMICLFMLMACSCVVRGNNSQSFSDSACSSGSALANWLKASSGQPSYAIGVLGMQGGEQVLAIAPYLSGSHKRLADAVFDGGQAQGSAAPPLWAGELEWDALGKFQAVTNPATDDVRLVVYYCSP